MRNFLIFLPLFVLIILQGPDGSIGFASGWTKRVSKFASKDENKSNVVRSDKEDNENKDT